MAIPFKDITSILQGYSFEAKMNICMFYSMCIFKDGACSIENASKEKMPFPWELEVFTLFSVIENEDNQKRTFESNEDKIRFLGIINSIRNYLPPIVDTKTDGILDVVSYGFAATQFKVQRNIIWRLARYHYIFNAKTKDVDMPKEMAQKFDLTFDQFAEFAFSSYAVLQRAPLQSYSIVLDLIRKYPNVFSKLRISRSDLIKEQNKFYDGIECATFCFKPFYNFPFIEHQGTHYLPLPNLLIDSISDCLYARLVQNNNELRSKIGKHVLEEYLLLLLSKTGVYDKVEREIEYHAKQKRSPDVMVLTDGHCILYDMKALAPKLSLRTFKEEDIHEIKDRLCDMIIKMFKSMNDFPYYSPFGNIERNKLLGVIVLMEDPCTLRNQILENVLTKLEIDESSSDAKFIKSNIRIMSLAEVENYCFLCCNMLPNLLKVRDDANKWGDITIGVPGHKKTHEFIDDVTNSLGKMTRIALIDLPSIINLGRTR